MKLFSCHLCQQLIFFENVHCTRCNHTLAYLPDRAILSAMQPLDGPPGATSTSVPADAIWVAQAPAAAGAQYRLCRNYTEHAVCNWAVPAGSAGELCQACSLNDIIPNLSEAGSLDAWRRLEIAKRRLIYTLMDHGLPIEAKVDGEGPRAGLLVHARRQRGRGQGLDRPQRRGRSPSTSTRPTTPSGRRCGCRWARPTGRCWATSATRSAITTGTGSSAATGWQPRFRTLFGDETADYAAAVSRHYENGPASDWPGRFVSAYASMHPWEDWAETWAHYLHMTDTLDTARAYGLSIRPTPVDADSRPRIAARRIDLHSFEDLMSGWVPLTIALNSLNRSMGQPDSYPFVISPPGPGEAAVRARRGGAGRGRAGPSRLAAVIRGEASAPRRPGAGQFTGIFAGGKTVETGAAVASMSGAPLWGGTPAGVVMDVGHRSNGGAEAVVSNGAATRGRDEGGIHERLREDVRLLGDLLGETLRAQEGPELYTLVERVRALAKQARAGGARGGGGAARRCWGRWACPRRCRWPGPSPTSWRSPTSPSSTTGCACGASACGRRAPAARSPRRSPGSCRRGVPPERLHEAVGALHVELVLTAHPTQATRRTLLEKHRRIAATLAARDRPDLLPEERAAATQDLRREIQAIWQTDELRRRRPTPVDEARAGLVLFDQVLWDALPAYLRELDRALLRRHRQGAAARRGARCASAPGWAATATATRNVTAAVTAEVCLLARWQAAELYLREVERLHDELSMTRASAELRARVGEAAEPYRVLLREVMARLRATRAHCEGQLRDLHGQTTLPHSRRRDQHA